MKACFCRFILAILVIVLAWWAPSWGRIALTVIGGLLAILALLNNKCCCQSMCEEKKE